MKKLASMLGASLLLPLSNTGLQAQERDEMLVLEEVIVTASRRVEPAGGADVSFGLRQRFPAGQRD